MYQGTGEHCQFERYDAEGNKTFTCDNVNYRPVIYNRAHDMIRLCEDHLFWMPDMKWWRPDDP